MRSLLCTLLLACCFLSGAGNDPSQRVIIPHISPALKFTENLGQWQGQVLFRAQLDGGALFLEKDGLTFSFYDRQKFRALHHGTRRSKQYADQQIRRHAYKVHFENGDPNAVIEKMQMGTDYENFFLGKDPKKWKGHVQNYHQVWLRNLYPGIDYEAITAAGGIKYNFHVKPGGTPGSIRLRYEGVEDLQLRNGALIVKLSINGVTEQRPYAYQLIGGKVVPVACEYRLKNYVLSFVFPGGYNEAYALVIDPLLVFAAQSGSTADNFGMTATYDPQGNLYAGGTAFDNGYPSTLGAYASSFSGTPSGYDINDVVITKYNPSGTALLYSTYFGGTESDIVTSMIVDANNNLCFYGATGSSDLPVTANAYDNSFNGGSFLKFTFNGTTFNNGTDIYVAKFNPAGTALLAGTYLGGSGNDGVNHVNHTSYIGVINGSPAFEYVTDSLQFNYGDQYRGEIQLDAANNIYIASSTRSADFPVVGGFDNTLGGRQDAVIAKFDSNLSTLIYSSLVGGDLNDAGNALLVKDNMEVYMTGGTCSGTGFPGTGGYQSAYQGGKADAFVIRINASGNAVLNRTFFGTGNYDQAYFIQSDKYNDIYIYGQSLGNIPVLAAANETVVFNVPGTHQFISRFNRTLTTLNMSTVFGQLPNKTDISPCAFAVDKCLNIYISGWGSDLFDLNTTLSGMPLLQPTQSTTDGHDFYFMGLDSNAKALKYGSYFGGGSSHEHVDGGTSRFDPAGRIYQSACAGCGGFDDWPVTNGAWPNTPGNSNHSGNCNNGVVKLDFQLHVSVATINTNTLTGCVPMTVTLTNAVPSLNPLSTYKWYLGNGLTTSVVPNPTVTYTTAGVYTIALVIRDDQTCNRIDSTINIITVLPGPTAGIGFNATSCSSAIQFTASSGGNVASNPYTWNFGDSTPASTLGIVSHTYTSSGIYTVSLQVAGTNGCLTVKTLTLPVFSFTPAVTNASLCTGHTATLTASGGTSYTWSPAGSLSNPQSATPQANPSATTIYTVHIVDASSGYDCAATLTMQLLVNASPQAGFTWSGNPCSNVISLTNTSTGTLSAASYTWDFGNGNQSTSGNLASYTYPGNGNYTLSLLVRDVNGCTDVRTATLSIFNFTPGVVSGGSVCSGFSTTITAQGGTGYTWTPASSLDNGFTGSPVASPTANTVYTVQILNTTPGYNCAKTLTTQVVVKPSPVAGFSYSLSPCGGDVWFSDNSGAGVTAWNWTLGSAFTSTLQDPYQFYTAGGTFTVTLRAFNQYGCYNSTSSVITVATPPQVTAGSSVAICRGESVQLHAGGGVAYLWSPAESLDVPSKADPVATPTVDTEYAVDITTALTNTASGKPCQVQLTTLVKVVALSALPVAAQASPTVVTAGNGATLTYLGSPGATVTWFPAGSTSPGVGYAVNAFPDKPTTYTAVITNGPCQEKVTVHVDAFSEGCLDSDVFIPNTFTPNGDKQNDELFVRGLKVSEVYFAVYNRWGELVFDTRDVSKGWDGTYKGKPAEVGVFGWYLNVKCVNGGEAFKKGNVTLIR